MTRTLAALILLCGPALAAGAVDGDTLKVVNQNVRLWGIDAPERRQTCEGRDGRVYECGRDAAAVLADLVRDQAVTCVARDTDRYGRIVATCSTEAGDLGAAMVRRGWAIDYARFSRGAYAKEEAAARAERLGIWSGRFQPPAEFRRERR